MSPKPSTPRVGGLFRHYKHRNDTTLDRVYVVDAVARDSEDPDRWLVVYSNPGGETWVRPREAFVEDIHTMGYHGPRFIPVEDPLL